jgi:hypothetical protein
MVLEAEGESRRCQVKALGISKRIQRDNEALTMLERERRDLELEQVC